MNYIYEHQPDKEIEQQLTSQLEQTLRLITSLATGYGLQLQQELIDQKNKLFEAQDEE